MGACLVWMFGRGASAACGLKWTVPPEWEGLERSTQIEKIKRSLRQEMDAEYVDTSAYKNLIEQLERRTTNNWHHRFVSTNWDYLLQREIERLGLKVAPHWLPETHVYHLNGTIEELEDNGNRSPFLLETDDESFREQTIEANAAFNHLVWQRHVVIIGMSFACEMDRSFLSAISHVEDDFLIGDSEWLILNRNKESLEEVATLVKHAIPHATISETLCDFREWASGPMRNW